MWFGIGEMIVLPYVILSYPDFNQLCDGIDTRIETYLIFQCKWISVGLIIILVWIFLLADKDSLVATTHGNSSWSCDQGIHCYATYGFAFARTFLHFERFLWKSDLSTYFSYFLYSCTEFGDSNF